MNLRGSNTPIQRKDNPFLAKEMQEKTFLKAQKADMLIEKWDRTSPGVKLMDLAIKNRAKARRIAEGLQAQSKYLKKLQEEGTQIKSTFSTVPENVLRIIRVGLSNSNRAQIFNEWQLETTDDAFYFVDSVYGSTKRGATAGNVIYESIAPNYRTEYNTVTIGTGDGSTLTFGPVLFTPTPLIANTVRVFVDGVPVGNDNGSGGFSGATLAGSSSVNYTSGSITIVFTGGNAPANGAIVSVEANWDSEKVDNYDEWGSIELRLRRDRFNARPMPLTYSYSKMFELSLGTTGVGDAQEMLIKRVGDEHAAARDYKAFQLAMRQAKLNPQTTFDADFQSAGSDNLYNHAQTVLNTIKKVGGQLYDDIKRGVINNIVAGSQVSAFFEMHKSFTPDTTQPRVGGSYLAGKLSDINVYTTPSNTSGISSTQALLCYRNPDEDGDVGIAFGVLTEIAAMLDYPELYRKGTLATVEDYKPINSKFYRILNFTNL